MGEDLGICGETIIPVNYLISIMLIRDSGQERFQGFLTSLYSPFSWVEQANCIFLGSDLIKGITIRGSINTAIIQDKIHVK